MQTIPNFNSILESIKRILLESKGLERPLQHEFIQQELYKLFRRDGFDSFFEYEISYLHKYRGTKQAGKEKLVRNGRIDIVAQKDDTKIALEFDSGATIKWKSIEKLLQCDAGYCFGIVSGPKTDSKLKIKMYKEKNLFKWQISIEDHLISINQYLTK